MNSFQSRSLIEPSPGPDWTALPELMTDSSDAAPDDDDDDDDGDEEEQVIFTPPSSQQPNANPMGKNKRARERSGQEKQSERAQPRTLGPTLQSGNAGLPSTASLNRSMLPPFATPSSALESPPIRQMDSTSRVHLNFHASHTAGTLRPDSSSSRPRISASVSATQMPPPTQPRPTRPTRPLPSVSQPTSAAGPSGPRPISGSKATSSSGLPRRPTSPSKLPQEDSITISSASEDDGSKAMSASASTPSSSSTVSRRRIAQTARKSTGGFGLSRKEQASATTRRRLAEASKSSRLSGRISPDSNSELLSGYQLTQRSSGVSGAASRIVSGPPSSPRVLLQNQSSVQSRAGQAAPTLIPKVDKGKERARRDTIDHTPVPGTSFIDLTLSPEPESDRISKTKNKNNGDDLIDNVDDDIQIIERPSTWTSEKNVTTLRKTSTTVDARKTTTIEADKSDKASVAQDNRESETPPRVVPRTKEAANKRAVRKLRQTGVHSIERFDIAEIVGNTLLEPQVSDSADFSNMGDFEMPNSLLHPAEKENASSEDRDANANSLSQRMEEASNKNSAPSDTAQAGLSNSVATALEDSLFSDQEADDAVVDDLLQPTFEMMEEDPREEASHGIELNDDEPSHAVKEIQGQIQGIRSQKDVMDVSDDTHWDSDGFHGDRSFEIGNLTLEYPTTSPSQSSNPSPHLPSTANLPVEQPIPDCPVPNAEASGETVPANPSSTFRGLFNLYPKVNARKILKEPEIDLPGSNKGYSSTASTPMIALASGVPVAPEQSPSDRSVPPSAESTPAQLARENCFAPSRYAVRLDSFTTSTPGSLPEDQSDLPLPDVSATSIVKDNIDILPSSLLHSNSTASGDGVSPVPVPVPSPARVHTLTQTPSVTIFNSSLSKLPRVEDIVPDPLPVRRLQIAGRTSKSQRYSSKDAKDDAEQKLRKLLNSIQKQRSRRTSEMPSPALRTAPELSKVTPVEQIPSISKDIASRPENVDHSISPSVAERTLNPSSLSQDISNLPNDADASTTEARLPDDLQALDINSSSDNGIEHVTPKIAQQGVEPIPFRRPSLKRRPSRSAEDTIKVNNSGGDGALLTDEVDQQQRAAKRARLDISVDSAMTSRKPPSRQCARKSARAVPRIASTHSSDADEGTCFTSSADAMDTSTSGAMTEEPVEERSNSPVSGIAMAVSRIAVTAPEDSSNVYHGRHYRQAKDLDYSLHNWIAALSDEQRSRIPLQLIFEMQTVSNTTEDDPEAPPIKVINTEDNEAAPPFEFFYSNLMWYANGVPPPDYKNLQGCDCIGACDPKSKTCSCLRRQKHAFRDGDAEILHPTGFLYDNKGRLTFNHYPIVECNDACGCSDYCTNRVVQQGRKVAVNIVKTKHKGWGVIAVKRIPKGTFIGVYSGELVTDAEAEERGMYYNKFGRTYLFDIDFWHSKKDDGENEFSVDAYHVGNFTRFLNHSCEPNCVISAVYINDADLKKPLLALFADRDIAENEEVTFSYFGMDDDEEEVDETQPTVHLSPGKQRDKIYTECRCGAKNCRKKLFQ